MNVKRYEYQPSRWPLLARALLAVAGLLPAIPGARGDETVRDREWHFDVLLDGKLIGGHDFIVSGTDDAVQVLSRAHFLVRVLRVPVYRYEHEDHERWRGGCLLQIDATTSDNGRRSRVQGTAGASGFTLSGPHGASSWPGCVRSFAYWDRRLLGAQRLLNAQTGEYQPVRITRTVDAGAAPGAEHYHLEGSGFHIELWYGADGAWRALESQTEQGKILRYEIHS